MQNKIIEFPTAVSERKDIVINGKQYDAYYRARKSMLPHCDMDYIGYYDFDLEEHGALCGFLFVEEIADNENGTKYNNVLFDPAGGIAGCDLQVDALKATALAHIARVQ